MVRRLLLPAAALALIAIPPAHAECEDLLPAAPAAGPKRAITARDLVRFRDVGDPLPYIDYQSPLGLSPDGADLAFVVSRADPLTNRICRGLVAVPVQGGPPRLLDRGGELIITRGIYRGIWESTGFPETVTPLWSPDGKWIAWRKRIGGVTQLWRVRADGRDGAQVTQDRFDVENFAWSADSRTLVVARRANALEAEKALDAEGRTGWLYDERVVPNEGWRPNPWAKDVPLEIAAIDLASGTARTASAAEAARIPAEVLDYRFESAAASVLGYKAWTEAAGSHPLASKRLWAADPPGARIACRAAACQGRIGNIWWDPSGTALVFQRRQGWNNEETALYHWEPRSGRVRPLLRTLDVLTGCRRTGDTLVCGRENAAMPRRIVAIDLRSGKERLVFDTNPEFARIALGPVRRLRWKNAFGLPAWGDLVLPADYDGKRRLPLVVVTYFSHGFLRGGVGDDYPIYLFAALGFAVLSVERAPHVAGSFPDLKTWDQVNAVGRRDWGERRNLLSTTLGGVDGAIATGMVDPARVGITGLSDGASNVEFALINSNRFAAAAMSTCCEGPVTDLVMGGPGWGDWNHAVMGYPLSIDQDRTFWQPMSLAVNARQMNTPLLLQLADREALLALETYGALREAKKPVEMIVFDQEYHNKVQPAHRLAVYTRSVDWFRFWLMGAEDPAPDKQAQYRRWQGLRARTPPVR